MATRREFLARSSAAAAAVVLAPQDALAARSATAVSGGPPTCCAAAASTRACSRAIPRRTRSRCSRWSPAPRAPAACGSRSRATRTSAASSPAATSSRREAIHHSVKARVTGLRPHRRYYYRFETRDRHSPVGRFQTALPPDSRAAVRFGFFSCADFTHGHFNAYERLARRGPRLRRLPRRLHLRRDLRRGRRRPRHPQRPDRPAAALLPDGRCARRRRCRSTARSTRSTAPTRRCASCMPRSRSSPPGTTTRCRTTTPTTRRTAGCRCARGFSRARRDAAYQAFFEAMPVFPRGRSRVYRTQEHGRTVDLMMLDERQYRATSRAATRSRSRAAAGTGRARSSAAASSAFLEGAAEPLQGGVEGGRRPVADDAQPRPRRAVPALRLLAGLSARARAPAPAPRPDAGSRTSSSSPATSTRSWPATSSPAWARARRSAVEFAAGSITSASVGESNFRMPGRPARPRQRRHTRHAARHRWPTTAGSTRGSSSSTSTATATGS